MKPLVDRWWFSTALWVGLIALFVAGTVALVSIAMAHADCFSCAAQARDRALTTYFVGGLALVLVAAVARAALAGRMARIWIPLAAIAGLLVLLIVSFIILQPGLHA